MTFAELMAQAGQGDSGLRRITDGLLSQGEPFVFRGNPTAHAACLDYFSTRLGVQRDGVIVVGSGKLGFSLNPRHPGTPFRHLDYSSEEGPSDVDVAICDTELFDKYWELLLQWRYPWHVSKWDPGDKLWGSRILENLFAGQVHPNEIRYVPVGRRSIRRKLQGMADDWFSTFRSTSLVPGLGSFEYNGRLYRSLHHAARYHEEGLRALRRRFGE